MTNVGDKKSVPAGHDRVAKRHRFGRRGGFVEHRGIGDIERGQIGDHRLEIEQRFEPALRDFGLIRRVGSVPTGILQNVPLNDRRRDAIGIAGADKRAHHACSCFEIARSSASASRSLFAAGRLERPIKPDILRDSRVDQ